MITNYSYTPQYYNNPCMICDKVEGVWYLKTHMRMISWQQRIYWNMVICTLNRKTNLNVTSPRGAPLLDFRSCILIKYFLYFFSSSQYNTESSDLWKCIFFLKMNVRPMYNYFLIIFIYTRTGYTELHAE